MNPKYYRDISPLGKPIIDCMDIDDYLEDECIDTIHNLEANIFDWNFNMSSALKYLWRLGKKTEDCRDDLRKAIQYLKWEYEATEDADRVRMVAKTLTYARQTLYMMEP